MVVVVVDGLVQLPFLPRRPTIIYAEEERPRES